MQTMSSVDERQKVAGVLGGMGPAATIDFMNKVIASTPARRDQDHIRMLVEHNPKVPSRQNTSDADDTIIRSQLADMALRLEAAGADFLVMVCNTAHGWLDEARRAVSIPFFSIVDVTVEALRERHPEVSAVAIMATPACTRGGLYQAALADAGITAVVPDDEALVSLMTLIDRVKAGDQGTAVSEAMADVATRLVADGADAVLAGCTEIPLVLHPDQLTVPLISSTDELARRTVALALGTVPLQSGGSASLED